MEDQRIRLILSPLFSSLLLCQCPVILLQYVGHGNKSQHSMANNREEEPRRSKTKQKKSEGGKKEKTEGRKMSMLNDNLPKPLETNSKCTN